MKLSRNIILASIAAVAASCSDDTLPGTNPDNGERTPLNVAVALSNGTPLSRAEGNTFAAGDSLYAYIRQVEWNGTEDYSAIGVVTPVTADQSPSLVLFKVTSDAMSPTEDSNTQQTSNLTASSYWTGSDWLSITGGKLYWDDFGTAEKPLTATGSYLQSAWGFCYNGGTPTTALSQTDGTIGWTAAGDFDSAEKLRNNDLLWSKAQKPLKYEHGTFGGNDHGMLVIPYTHAMSMITIEVVAADGFTTGNLGSTTATLQDMYKSATFSAPNATVSSQADSQSVAMLAGTEGTNGGKPNKVFQALVIPGKTLTTGIELAVISDIDGNNYKIPVTQTIIEAWSSYLDDRKLKSGVNYKLTVTVAKQAISVVAQITDWTPIEATGKGEINFSADVTDSGVENGITNGSIDIFRAEDLASMNTMTTTATYNSGKWVNSPEIYWANGTQSYYFRALTEYDGSKYNSVGGSKNLARGHDVLWGTTNAHSGTAADGSTFDYAEGAAIAPRTGNVPLTFSHVMSKITVNLTTDESDAKVVLDGAKITINGLNETGTIEVKDGTVVLGSTTTDISDFAAKSHPITDVSTLNGYVVMPQVLGNEIRLRVKLADGTTYSLQLNQCLDSSKQVIGEWKKGTHYEYTIKLTKEAIDFVALVKKWEDVSGGGDANLDWD